MYLSGINALNYLQGNYGLGSINRKTSTLNFQDVLQRAAGRPVTVGNYSPSKVTSKENVSTDTTASANNSLANVQAQLTFAAALAYQQAILGAGYQTCMPTTNNWANVVNNLIQTPYNTGSLQGYLNYSNYLGLLL